MISIDRWLESFGLFRNPFETTEAGSEAYYVTEFLHETFVKPQGFDNLLGHPSRPKSTIVFAARGQGKTSARLMTAHFCREGIFSEKLRKSSKEKLRVLPIQHTRFEHLSQGAQSQSALVFMHVVEILYRAIPDLINMLMRTVELQNNVESLDVLQRLELQFFLLAFRGNLSFDEFKFGRELFGKEIISLDEARVPIGFSLSNASSHANLGLSAQEIEDHLSAYAKANPIDLFSRFVNLAVKIGFSAVYVLIDCVDEIPETADDFTAAADILIPLLSNLNLMTNTPYLAFKVFVPHEMKTNLLEATRQVRKDRLSRLEIKLSEQDLVEILTSRLSYCSGGVVSSLDAVCEVGLRGQIMNELARIAEGNPRHLVLLGQYMLENRCHAIVDEDDYLLTKNDLEAATNRLKTEFQSIIPNEYIEGVFYTADREQEIIIQQPMLENIQEHSRDWFRHELPAPIALSYLVYQRESYAYQRLWKLYELIEASLAYMSLVLLAMLAQNLGDETPKRIKRSGLRLERTSLGIWRIALEKLPGMLSGIGLKSYFARACQRLVNEHKEFLQTINDERNRSAHGGPQPDQACTEMLGQFDDPLHDFLDNTQFLRNSHLIRVESVQKYGETYRHRCIHYVGDAAVYPTIEITLPKPLESNSLWLIGEDDPVNLHPLIAATANEKLGEDIWLYQGREDDSVLYKAYGLGRIEQSSTLFRESPRINL